MPRRRVGFVGLFPRPTLRWKMSLTIRHTLRTGRGYIEPLLEITNGLPLHMVFVPGGTLESSLAVQPSPTDLVSPQRRAASLRPLFWG